MSWKIGIRERIYTTASTTAEEAYPAQNTPGWLEMQLISNSISNVHGVGLYEGPTGECA